MQYAFGTLQNVRLEAANMSILINPHRHERMPELDQLYVVTTIFNPMRYKSRYELFWSFRDHMRDLGAKLMVIEVALGDRPFEVTQPGNPLHVQLRTTQEFWLKECALNVGISRLPTDWKYVMWADADIHFARSDILEETVHQLQHYHIVQCWEDAIDLGPRGEVIEVHKGFVWSWHNLDEALQLVGGSWHEIEKQCPYYYAGPKGKKSRTAILHPGYAWAARREALVDLGGLFDVGLLGAADHHMAHCLVGRGLKASPTRLSPGYKRALVEWEKRANTHIRGNIGVVPGSITHSFHGKKKDRKYRDRWEILFKHNFEPDTDLKRDWNGLYALTHHGQRMRNDLRRYFIARCEDSIDT